MLELTETLLSYQTHTSWLAKNSAAHSVIPNFCINLYVLIVDHTVMNIMHYEAVCDLAPDFARVPLVTRALDEFHFNEFHCH